jgi:hypothetical protein
MTLGERRRIGEQADGFAVAVQRAYVHVGRSSGHALCLSSAGQILIYERTYIFIATLALAPEAVQVRQFHPGHFEGAPDPMAAGIWLAHSRAHL